jgi:hypothetical protein
MVTGGARGGDTPPLRSPRTDQEPLGALRLLNASADLPLLRVVTFTGNGSGIAGSSRDAKSGPAAAISSHIAVGGPTAIGSAIGVGIVRLGLL